MQEVSEFMNKTLFKRQYVKDFFKWAKAVVVEEDHYERVVTNERLEKKFELSEKYLKQYGSIRWENNWIVDSNTPLCFVYITINGTRAWVTYTFYHENIALY